MSLAPNNAGNPNEDGHPEYSIDTTFTCDSCTMPTSSWGHDSASGCSSGQRSEPDQKDTISQGDETLSGTTKRSKGKGKRPDPNKLAETMGKHMEDTDMTPRVPARWPEWETSGTEQMSVFLRRRLDQSRPAEYKAIKFKEGAEEVEQAVVFAIFSCLSTLPEASQVLQVHIFRVNASRSVLTFIDDANDWCYILVDWDKLDAWMVEWREYRPMKRVTAFPTLG